MLTKSQFNLNSTKSLKKIFLIDTLEKNAIQFSSDLRQFLWNFPTRLMLFAAKNLKVISEEI